jgi:hypothetical protein
LGALMNRGVHVLAAAFALGALGGNCGISIDLPDNSCTSDLSCSDVAFCNGAELCVDGFCVAGEPPCECSGACNESLNSCGDCCTDFDCDDGLFCNGDEECVDGVCFEGVPPCDEGVPAGCLTFCFEDDNTCADPCFSDFDCDDGIFCNGAEVCDACGLCVLGEPPCGDGVGDCCDETFAECPECCDDFDCDDGFYCNGEEVCEAGLCFAGVTPCEFDGELCPETCDEFNEECVVECLSDADCDDGVLCNGQELCVECGLCVIGAEPCDFGETCIEGDVGFICVP